MELNYSIRSFNINDYDDVISLWKESGLPFKPKGRDRKKKIKNELDSDSAIFLVAEIDNDIIGVVFGTHDGRKGWINRLAVHPNYRNNGIAKSLIDELEKQLLGRGIEIMTCLIEGANKVSHNIFIKLGFKHWNEISYYSKRMNPDV
jgi:ribosomal protein S18 acetylase RimI-like enzyme